MSSLHEDRRLFEEDIAGSRAHAAMLHDAGLIDAEQHAAIDSGLQAIEAERKDGTFAFQPADEDIHTAIERRLHELQGPVAGMLHAGRSRNDQVATDLRLWVKRNTAAVTKAALALQEALIRRAEEHAGTIVPGYTHLQRAQPVSLAHHLLAYVAMLRRDVERILDARARADVLPLGSGAVAGSTLPLDRERTRSLLQFAAVAANSMDAVSDRDFVVETISACALCMVHCSRLGEDLVLWTSSEFGFAELDDSHATGSSLMPQKKNPDVAELARGRAARVIGDVVTALTMLKGLPLAYNRDLQEDKRPLFDAVDMTAATLATLTELIAAMRFDVARMRAAASDPALLATDVAEHLVQHGVPFRRAHQIVAGVVADSQATGRSLAEVTLDEWRAAAPEADESLLSLFDLATMLERRSTPGGPSAASVRAQIRDATAHIERTRTAIR